MILCGWIRRNAANNIDSQLFYSYSTDGGVTWAPNVAVSNSFNPLEGWPIQQKIGDYITIVSDNTGGDVAYSATYNFNPSRGQHEQDVYFVRVSPSRWPDANAHCYCYANSYCNHYTERYSYRYAKADAHAAIRAHAQAASHTGAETVMLE